MRSISISARVGDQYARSAAGHQQFGGRVDDNTDTRSLSLAYCVVDAFEKSQFPSSYTTFNRARKPPLNVSFFRLHQLTEIHCKD